MKDIKFTINNLFNLLREKTTDPSKIYIAGGSALSYIGEHPSKSEDIDLFFETEEAFNECLYYFQYKFKSNYSTENAISFTVGGIRYQLIQKFFMPIKDILETFDFKNVMVAINCETKEVIDKRSGAGRTIVLNNYLSSSLWRLIKYSKYGFKIPNEIIRQYIENHKNGALKPLYNDGRSNTPEELLRYACMAIPKDNTEMIKILLEAYPDEFWLEEALFSNNRHYLEILSEENKSLAVTRFQELAFEVNLGNFKNFSEEIRDLYPEYFIAGKKVYRIPKLEEETSIFGWF